MKLRRIIRRLTEATASLDVPDPAGDYAQPDPTGYVPRPHVAQNVDEQTGLNLSLMSEAWRLPR